MEESGTRPFKSDPPPEDDFAAYVETELGMMLLWRASDKIPFDQSRPPMALWMMCSDDPSSSRSQ